MDRYRIIPKQTPLTPTTGFIQINPTDDYKKILLAVGTDLFGEKCAEMILARRKIRFVPSIRGYEIWDSDGSLEFLLVPDVPRTWRIHFASRNHSGLWDWESNLYLKFARAVKDFAFRIRRAEEIGLPWFRIRLLGKNPVTGEEMVYCEVEDGEK